MEDELGQKSCWGCWGLIGRRLANQIGVRKQEKEADRCTSESLGEESRQVGGEKRVSRSKEKKKKTSDSPSNEMKLKGTETELGVGTCWLT